MTQLTSAWPHHKPLGCQTTCCHSQHVSWLLTPAEVKAHTAELDARRSAGKVVRRPHKKRSDAGISHKHKALPGINKENNGPSKKVKKISANHRDAPKSTEFIESSDEED
ncbi:hypothetical protein BDR05DRAFT_1004976 [Suillus weaverae]|nr:hypothetical protein BDR05DRAFT_1004976 [Suillus weaverae]